MHQPAPAECSSALRQLCTDFAGQPAQQGTHKHGTGVDETEDALDVSVPQRFHAVEVGCCHAALHFQRLARLATER